MTTPDPDPRDPWDRFAIAGVTAAIAIVTLLAAFFVERQYGSEEFGVFNAAYMYAAHGHGGFPIYAYPHPAAFDRLYLHLPPHYFAIGMLMRLGVDVYYAEALPAVLLILGSLALIVTLPARPREQLGMLFGAGSAIGLFSLFESDYFFHVRPDAHMALAWFASLLVLEHARRRAWSSAWLFAGAVLSAYASVVHYSGILAFCNCVVYVAMAWRDLPWRAWLTKVAWAFAGGMLIAGPFLALVVFPAWNPIRVASGMTKPAGLFIATNFPLYSSWAGFIDARRANPFNLLYVWPIKVALAWLIPPFVIATILLGVRRETRALALAGLPVPLFLFFIARRKLENYLYPELTLALVGFWVVVLTVLFFLVDKTGSRRVSRGATVMAAGVFVGALGFGTPSLKRVEWSWQPRVHEMTIARAAARTIVGPDAVVTSMHGLWYISGAAHWIDDEHDLMLTKPNMDEATFWRRFDAVATFNESWNHSYTGVNETSLYRDRALALKGFFISAAADARGWTWFGPPGNPVQGYVRQGHRLMRFKEAAAGDYVLETRIVRVAGWGQRPAGLDALATAPGVLLTSFMVLPETIVPSPQDVVTMVLAPAEQYRADIAARMPAGTILETIRGTVEPVDAGQLVAAATDTPIEFIRTGEELWARRTTPVPGAVPSLLTMREYGGVIPGRKTVVENRRTSVTVPAVVQQWLVHSENVDVEPHSYYVASLSLALRSGWVQVDVRHPDDPVQLATMVRVRPQSSTRERFLVYSGEYTKLALLVTGYNLGLPLPVDFTVDDARLEKVDMLPR